MKVLTLKVLTLKVLTLKVLTLLDLHPQVDRVNNFSSFELLLAWSDLQEVTKSPESLV